MHVHLVDGTYELFRSYYGAPPATAPDGREVGAVRGLLASLGSLLREPGVTHVACAFDTVIESFRNDLFAGYKTGEGIEPALWAQFGLAERAVRALGIVVWSMVEFEADDALATGAVRYGGDARVERVLLCTPDKDLAQMVSGERIVGFDRRKKVSLDEAGVQTKFGVAPASIPDLLALVGDEQDGIPGVPRWGSKSAATVLAHYGSLEQIPADAARWQVAVRGATALADSLAAHRAEAVLYKRLATLRTDVPIAETLEELRWQGPRPELAALCQELGYERFLERFDRG
ncbi:MAG TPA: 5'-3' exonuclease H3TH domain-containing protein [Planctomycetota bacterium]|nr:5'-3' exonuclease H3TH domain-containing protein [Planctomycetota bacterium]